MITVIVIAIAQASTFRAPDSSANETSQEVGSDRVVGRPEEPGLPIATRSVSEERPSCRFTSLTLRVTSFLPVAFIRRVQDQSRPTAPFGCLGTPEDHGVA